MAEFDLLQAIIGRWEDGPVRLGGPDALAVQLVAGGTLDVRTTSGADVVELAATWEPAEPVADLRLAELADAATDAGIGQLICMPRDGVIEIRNKIWLEGASRQSLTLAIVAVGRAYELLARMAGAQTSPQRKPASRTVVSDGAAADEPTVVTAATEQPDTGDTPVPTGVVAQRRETTPTPAVAPAAQPPPGHAAEPSTMPARPPAASQEPAAAVQPPTAAPMHPPAPAQTPLPATQPPAPVAATMPVWSPTHRVPPQGMTAWANPDPGAQVVATLGGGLELQVSQRWGDWARVVATNGWYGWVDARLLQPR